MLKASFLIPLADNAGSPWARDRFEWLEEELLSQFGGWQIDAEVRGGWRNPEGRIFQERSLRYIVALEQDKLPGLRKFLAREVGEAFEQEAIYLEVADAIKVEIIKAEEDDD